MGQPLDQNLINHVVGDQGFQQTGLYYDKDGTVDYVVIDVSKHDIDVWIKVPKNTKTTTAYRATAKGLTANVFSNGPLMSAVKPLITTVPTIPGGPITMRTNVFVAIGAGIINKIHAYFVSNASQSVGPIYHNGSLIEKGVNPNAWGFGRIGSGNIQQYKIQNGLPPQKPIEWIGGMHMIISQRKVKLRPNFACCIWGIVDHVVIVAGSKIDPQLIPDKLIDVGVSDAVGADGGTSAMMGKGNTTHFECVGYKDRIQYYGLYC